MLSSSICNNNKIPNLLIWIGLKKLYKKNEKKDSLQNEKKKTVGEGVWNLEVLSLKFFYVWFPDRNMVATLVRRFQSRCCGRRLGSCTGHLSFRACVVAASSNGAIRQQS